jgi:hypothetical protein
VGFTFIDNPNWKSKPPERSVQWPKNPFRLLNSSASVASRRASIVEIIWNCGQVAEDPLLCLQHAANNYHHLNHPSREEVVILACYPHSTSCIDFPPRSPPVISQYRASNPQEGKCQAVSKTHDSRTWLRCLANFCLELYLLWGSTFVNLQADMKSFLAVKCPYRFVYFFIRITSRERNAAAMRDEVLEKLRVCRYFSRGIFAKPPKDWLGYCLAQLWGSSNLMSSEIMCECCYISTYLSRNCIGSEKKVDILAILKQQRYSEQNSTQDYSYQRLLWMALALVDVDK